jgi:hypothetical protein
VTKRRAAVLVSVHWVLNYDGGRADDLVVTLNGEPTPRGTMLAPGAHVTFAPLCAALPVGPDGRSVADVYPGATVHTLRVYRAHALWDLVHIGPTFRVPD